MKLKLSILNLYKYLQVYLVLNVTSLELAFAKKTQNTQDFLFDSEKDQVKDNKFSSQAKKFLVDDKIVRSVHL